MTTASGWIRGPWVVALLVGSLAMPEPVVAAGHKGGGRGARAPRQAAPRRPSVAPRPQAAKATRGANLPPHANNSNNRAGNAKVGRVAGTATAAGGTRGTAGAYPAKGTAGRVAGTSASGLSAAGAHSYSYGTGSKARHYTANGYGHGYRNSSRGRGYGRSQGNSRALVSRLRSVHSGLAQLDHDYQGHRMNAMRSLSTAIRHLSHNASRSAMNRGSNRGGNGNNNGQARLVNGTGTGANGRAGQGNRAGRNGQANRMTQAQSDGRMTQALRTTQGIHMQMANPSSRSSGTSTARTHVARAMHELQTALAVR